MKQQQEGINWFTVVFNITGWLVTHITWIIGFIYWIWANAILGSVLPFILSGTLGAVAAYFGVKYTVIGLRHLGFDLHRWQHDRKRRAQINRIILEVLAHRGMHSPEQPADMGVHFNDDGSYNIAVHTPSGKTAQDVSALAEALAEQLEVYAVDPDTNMQRGWVVFRVFPEDKLAQGVDTPEVVNTAQAAQAAPQPEGTDVTTPVRIGSNHLGQPVNINLYSSTCLVGGSPGSGKSALTWTLLDHAALDPRTVLIVMDLKPEGIETRPIAERADYFVNDVDTALTVLKQLWAEIEQRNAYLAENMLDKTDPSDPRTPPIVLFIDEAAEFTRSGDKAGKEALNELSRVVNVGRASGIGTVIVTQKPSSDVIPTGLRDSLDQRIALRVGNRHMAETIMGSLDEGVRPWEIGSSTPGRGYLSGSDGQTTLFQSGFIDRDTVIEIGQVAARLRSGSGQARYELPEIPPEDTGDEDQPESSDETPKGGAAKKRRRRR